MATISNSNKAPKLYDLEPFYAAGINPYTGLPVKFDEAMGASKECIKRQLRIIDKQDAVNRFTWYNLPEGLHSKLIERILYYKGQGALFTFNGTFYFLPFALDGTIDVYGRFTSITPLSFNGTSTDGKDKPFIQGQSYTPVYDVVLPEDFIDELGNVDMVKAQRTLENSCVILRDRTEGISQFVEPRVGLQEGLLDVMSDCIPFMRTALLNATGVLGMRVQNENDTAEVFAASSAINKAALEGRKYVPIVGNIDFQELAGGDTAKAEEFLLAMQSLDNYRLSLYGLDNGGLFQKRSHMLEAEQEVNQGNVGLILRDSLECRQDFCDIVNSIWGTSIWCEPSETAIGADLNGDGILGSNEDEVAPTKEEEEQIDVQ